MLPIKSEDVEADKDADDMAMAAEAGVLGADSAGGTPGAVAVPPLSSLIMVSRFHKVLTQHCIFANVTFSVFFTE